MRRIIATQDSDSDVRTGISRCAAALGLLLAIILLRAPSPLYSAPHTQQSPYRISEFVVRESAELQSAPVISGSWVAWSAGGSAVHGINLNDGREFSLSALTGLNDFDLDENTLVAIESIEPGRPEVVTYQLPGLARTVVAAPAPTGALFRTWPRLDGNIVVWRENTPDLYRILGIDTTTVQGFVVRESAQPMDWPAVTGNWIVWADARDSTGPGEYDLYAFNRSTGQERRLTAQSGVILPPAVDEGRVAWLRRLPAGGYSLMLHDLGSNNTRQLLTLDQQASSGLAISGKFIVWSATGERDVDLFGLDIAQGTTFIINRAIGAQNAPSISGNVVVWSDGRASGVGRYETAADVFGARIEPGPAPPPPITGALQRADVKIEILWPHGGAPVTEANLANLSAWLFRSDTLELAPCQWNPGLRLWRAQNNESATPVEVSPTRAGDFYSVDSRAIPTWMFNDLEVSVAQEPGNTLYYYITLEDIPSRSNVWAHGADPRTFLPSPIIPTGTGAVEEVVEGRIQVVWPHGDAPVEQAQLVNVTAALFLPGETLSVPPDWSPTVRLWRGLNQEVLREVAVGQKRIVEQGGVRYPVWDFNDIDVSAARDPANKYFFRITVDNIVTHPNIWVHGADARTHFPQMDLPSRACD